MTERDAESHETVPVFSPRLDEIMALMLKGEIPNVGRFCGYCYTPVAKNHQACAHCGTSIATHPPTGKLPAPLFDLYRRMRRRESLIVNSFAYAGLALGLLAFTVIVAVAVYRYEAAWWLLAVATVVFIVGGRVLAGLLGGWIGDNVGYDYARRKLAEEWAAYESDRESRRAPDGTLPEHVPVPEPSAAAARG
jgi:hypothetical protein